MKHDTQTQTPRIDPGTEAVDGVAEWCKQHDVVHVKEYMNRGRE